MSEGNDMTEHGGPVARRELLTGGAALAGAAIAGLAGAEAAKGGHNTNVAYDSQEVMHLDVTNTTAGSTRIASDISGTAAFVGLNNVAVGISRPDGILGRTAYTTSNCAGVAGACEAASGGIGVLGTAKANDGTGVGVYGFSGSSVPSTVAPGGTGVYGFGPNRGMLGRSTSGNGLEGETTSGVGVLGTAGATGIAGRFVGRTVVEGALEASTLNSSGKSTLADVDASGPVKLAGTLDVTGKSTVAELDVNGPVNFKGPVNFNAPAGPGASAPATTVDRLSLPKTSGLVTLKRAAASISVANVPVGAGSLAIATLQRHRKGLYVVAAVPNASRKRITIHFNKRAPKGTKVAWMVVN
jgi:hypothetical protein